MDNQILFAFRISRNNEIQYEMIMLALVCWIVDRLRAAMLSDDDERGKCRSTLSPRRRRRRGRGRMP